MVEIFSHPDGVESGVAQFDEITTKWYGWAQKGTKRKEGPLRFFKWRASLDAWRLARKLR